MDDKQRYNELFSLFMKTLPKQINASNDKRTANHQENRNRDKLEVLKHYSFMQFNSPVRVSWMIFDIDHINDIKAVEVYTLNEMVHEIYAKIGCIPTYTLQTKKGYHFAFHLEQPVFLNNRKAKQYLKDIKAAITDAMQCDKIASNRLWGIWRNPLKHPFWYSGIQDYSLSSFKHLLKEKSKKYPNFTCEKNPLSVSINDLVEGQRNSKLFLFAVNYCLANQPVTYEDLTRYILSINEKAIPPLEDDEVFTICKSAYKRKQEGTLFLPKFAERDINVGAMELEKIQGLSYKEYLLETKRRQSKAAHWTNAKRSQKAKEASMQRAREAKIDFVHKKNLASIKQAIALLQQEQKKLTYANIAKASKLDRRTVKKYVEEYQLVQDG